ncbi:MAG: hypothetical protein DMF61_13735 [Blastocatellia bacterium AA13]|nr:MAG: hypothetical protein DMF61_13735 [Blastocatellia bacterium AA13]
MKENRSSSKKRVALTAPLAVGAAMLLVGCFSPMSGGGPRNTAQIPISATPIVTTNVRQSMEQFQGKVVILDFWATWCGPCRSEIPGFIALQNEYRDQGLEVVGVSIDPIAPQGGGAAAVEPFMKKFGVNYTIMMIQGQSAMAGYDVSQGIPTTYLVDRTGKITKTYVGSRSKTLFEQDLKQLL